MADVVSSSRSLARSPRPFYAILDIPVSAQQLTSCDQETPAAASDRPRKSVAFSEGTTIVDSNGEVTQTNGNLGDKDSAEAHSKPGMFTHPRLSTKV